MATHHSIIIILALTGLCVRAELNAKCVVEKTSGKSGSPPVEGVITLTEPESGDITIKVSLKGFNTTAQPTKHGFHIHKYGILTNGCLDAGGHFNPFNKDHGAPTDEERHVGDLGNLEVNTNGEAEVTITDKLIKLSGNNSVIGKSFVIHADEDDLGKGNFSDSKITGHAGDRFGCCKIVEDEDDISTASRLIVTSFLYIIVTVIFTFIH